MKDILFSYDKEYDICYSSTERALQELFQRRGNHALEKRVRDSLILTPELSSALEEPRLVLFRQIATPLQETAEFLRQASILGLKPLIFEYYDDKFVSAGNTFKRGLGKLPIFKFTTTSGIDTLEYKNIVDFNSYTGNRLREVRTKLNESLVDVHHELFNLNFNLDTETHTVDLSSWFSTYNHDAAQYYYGLMTLFLKDAILCENFITTKSEEDFFTRVARPAFKAICEEYGLDPLVIRIVDKEEENRLFWDCYPTQVNEQLILKGYN